MEAKASKTMVCQICKAQRRVSEVVPAAFVREAVVETIRRKYPNWSNEGFICLRDLNHFRTEHVQELLRLERGELSTLEEAVLKSLCDQEILSQNLNIEFEHQLTLGERIADRIAKFGGSWRFILIFAFILLAWLAINSVVFLWKPFDPYPYILLNLVLSCLAATQAPVIMMSQNRREAKDRLRAEHDYRVNLKAELEIRHLNAKMDQLVTHQWQRLLEIQQIQMEMMDELVRKGRGA